MRKYEYTITGTIDVDDSESTEDDIKLEIPYAVDNDLHTGAATIELKLLEEIVV